MDSFSRSTAAVIIVGNEILKGDTKDTNSHFLCQQLYLCGVKVCKVSVISDEVEEIADEINNLSSKYTFILTSGGIGPTHDDVTYEGVAKAFGDNLILNKELYRVMTKLCVELGMDESAILKMSTVPKCSQIHHTGGFLPIVSVKNVFVFPGIPSYLETAFTKLRQIFSKNATPFSNKTLYVCAQEFEITQALNATVKEYSSVRFGSYPILDNDYYQVKLTIEADCENAVNEAEAFLRYRLKENSVVGAHPPNSEEALADLKVVCSGKVEMASYIKKSMKILEDCFKRYSTDEVCLSFNGGKDCTALLHLTYLFLAKKYHHTPVLKALYIRTKQPFPEMEEFIDLTVKRYKLELLSYEQPIKKALETLKNDHPEVKAVLMGSRHTDPRCADLKDFQLTDEDWPQFMRVNALREWSYSQVWGFMRRLQVPYCSLYDRGYTSIGCQYNTQPNEQLSAKTQFGEDYFLPAYLLAAPEQERKGRYVEKNIVNGVTE